jgi:hypothetical protein
MSWLYSQALVEAYLGDNFSDGEQSVPLNGSHTQLAYLPPDTLVQTTKGTESGLWLTPTVMDGLPARNPEALERQYQNNRKGRSTHSTLREQVVYPPPKQMFPTPNAWDGKRGPRSEEHLRTKKAQVTLVTAVAQLERENFPTPCATDYKGAGQTGQLRDRLDYAAERGATKNKTFMEPTVPGGQLNPTWVEWLMGWTLGWTDLKPLAMDKSLSVPPQHGNS